MKHQSVDSSTVASVAHDPTTNTMEVKFKNGTTYTYHDVPASTHAKMMDSNSIGKFLHNHVKDNHKHTKH